MVGYEVLGYPQTVGVGLPSEMSDNCLVCLSDSDVSKQFMRHQSSVNNAKQTSPHKWPRQFPCLTDYPAAIVIARHERQAGGAAGTPARAERTLTFTVIPRILLFFLVGGVYTPLLSLFLLPLPLFTHPLLTLTTRRCKSENKQRTELKQDGSEHSN